MGLLDQPQPGNFVNARGETVSGFFLVNDIPVMQTVGVVELFRDVLRDFEQIVEIGSMHGGLTLLLHLIKPADCTLVSYDLNRAAILVPHAYGIDFRVGDAFSQATAQEIVGLLAAPKRTLLLCDGGNKESEFATYGQYLKPNDVIMLHDYAESDPDFAVHAQAAGWCVPPESRYEIIAPFVERYGLEPFEYERFKAVFWGAFVKRAPTAQD